MFFNTNNAKIFSFYIFKFTTTFTAYINIKMFKKREKSGNALKRSLEDRYLDESAEVQEEKNEEYPAPKRVKHEPHKEGCSHKHQNMASTKDHQHYRQEFISKEVMDMAAFKTSDSSVQAVRENAATKHLEVDTEYDRDAIAKAKENIEISRGIVEGRLDPKVYRGLHGYQNYFE